MSINDATSNFVSNCIKDGIKLLSSDALDCDVLKYLQVLMQTCRLYNCQLSEKHVQEAISQFRLSRKDKLKEIEFHLRIALSYVRKN